MAKELAESTIYSEVYKRMSMLGYFWNNDATNVLIDTTFKGMATFLASKKSKDKPVACVLDDINGEFHFGAVVEYQKAEEEGNDEGSWALAYTYDKNDIDPATMDVYHFQESQEMKTAFINVSYDIYGMRFMHEDVKEDEKKLEQINNATPDKLLNVVIDTVRDYMRQNVTIDPVLNISFVGKLTAIADANTNDVIIGIEPNAELRQIIKDDSSINK